MSPAFDFLEEIGLINYSAAMPYYWRVLKVELFFSKTPPPLNKKRKNRKKRVKAVITALLLDTFF